MKNSARVEPATFEQTPLIGGEAPAVRSTAPPRGGSPAKVFHPWTIPDAEQDKDLPARLREELPGMLARAVRGCLACQRAGSGTPDDSTMQPDAQIAPRLRRLTNVLGL